MPNRKPSDELQDLLDDFRLLDQYPDVKKSLRRIRQKVLFLEGSVDRHVQELKDAKEEGKKEG